MKSNKGFVFFPVVLIVLTATLVVGATVVAVKHFAPNVANAVTK